MVQELRLPSLVATSFFPPLIESLLALEDGAGEFGLPLPAPEANLVTSQYFNVLSRLPLTRPLASGVKATL
jgi:hypothetical protein